MTQEPFDARLQNPCSILLTGASNCGKTTLALSILDNIDILFVDPRCKQNVIYFYKQWNPSFDRFNEKGIVKSWRNHLPTTQEVVDACSPYDSSIICIDDWQQDYNTDILELFTIYAHHCNLVLICLCQSLFQQGNKIFRQISLNATYLIVFKNCRDKTQIRTLGSQFAPGNKWLVSAFMDITKDKPYSYMLMDLHPRTPESLRIRTNIIPEHGILTVYQENRK